MKTKSIGFIGGGRITRIFLKAYQNQAYDFDSIKVFDPDNDALDRLKEEFPGVEKMKSVKVVAGQEIVVLAVHPPKMMESLERIKNDLRNESWILSFVPKITISKIEAMLGTNKIIRMIPNATSFINQGYNPIAFHAGVNNLEKEDFLQFFKALGDTFETEENKLEAYAIVSAMLPTYFWFQWEEMVKIAGEIGLDSDEARFTVASSVKKALTILFDSDLAMDEVKDLIPVRPIGDHEEEIKNMYQTKLLGLYNKIKS